jgi:hypothetical protein
MRGTPYDARPSSSRGVAALGRSRVVEQLNTRSALLDTVRGLREEIDRVVAAAGEARLQQPGSFDELSCKDVIAHLTGWRLATAARLEAGLRDEAPVFPWPAQLNEEHDLDAINRWFYETDRDKPLAQVLDESRRTFERVERAIAEMSEEALFGPGRFAWLNWTQDGLGPAVVRGTFDHYHEEHEPEIRAWLARG